ncbi:magnesium/cobalt transporter CorA [Candidatus Woesearchaeota archaeon]|nr:magnesium/cobalt transporter CorA [Candidatus Woesearchaeota archaeon]
MLDIFYLNDGVKKGKLKDLPKLKQFPTWIDCTAITKEEANVLSEVYELHPLTTEDILQSNTRVKIEDFPNYLLCVFYGIEKDGETRLIEFDFVLGAHFVLSNHEKPVATFEELKNNDQKISKLLAKGGDFFFHSLLDNEVDNFFRVLESIDEEIAPIEEEVMTNPRPELLRRILQLKRSLGRVKKITVPQREKIGTLAKEEHRFISKKAIPYFRDVYDHAVRVADSLDNSREATVNTFDVYMSAMSNRTNEVMKLLSMIATIALPLTVISGIYGTNFDHLPGSKEWQGFWIMMTLMLTISVCMLYFFYKRRWIFEHRRW